MHLTFILETCAIVVTLPLLYALVSKQPIAKSFVLWKYYFKSWWKQSYLKRCYKCLTLSCSSGSLFKVGGIISSGASPFFCSHEIIWKEYSAVVKNDVKSTAWIVLRIFGSAIQFDREHIASTYIHLFNWFQLMRSRFFWIRSSCWLSLSFATNFEALQNESI